MAKTVTKYSIFIASPSDLQEERIAIEEVTKELNLTFGIKQNIVIELLKWETHSAPGISEIHPQEIINEDIGNEYDIFIGLLWKKFGTPTEKTGSGTEEEFLNAFDRFNKKENIQVLFYFKDAVPKSLKEINASELIKIENFKTDLCEKKALYWEFDTCENLKNFLRIHIPKRITNLIENSDKKTERKLVETIIEEEEYGLLDYSEMFEDFIHNSTNSLTQISESTQWIGAEITKKAEEITRLSKLPNVNNSVVRETFKRTAKLLENYINRLKTETPIYYTNFEDAIKAGSNLVNLSDDFKNDDTIHELEELKESLIILRTSLPDSLESMLSFYESVESLPRIQKDLNIAKKKLLIQLEDLIDKLRKSISLTTEFSNEIGNKIDKLSIENKK
ncbi:DUF4062 domain-containing protein [Pontimicrobium aquaticum]|uniref:DUF4062 domain-containing protein n=1 Tax=Pontimicrobium aquaticum TaxID=2565367 RepID=A0A4U0EZT9_9FLAO|nr:DUF4062 domain-containing protein [Pontimicrobium aquaticum]TJY35902.1 DUF4062 domain-containing protein [Pontimicrobium aquaticum]